MITFSTVVRDVVYNKDKDNFTVIVKDLLKDDVLHGQEFDYVIVASGHYSVPNAPSFPGINKGHFLNIKELFLEFPWLLHYS